MPFFRIALLVSCLAAPLAAQTATVKPFSTADSARFIALGKRASGFLLAQHADSLVAMMPADTAKRMGGLKGLQDKVDQLKERTGDMTKVLVQKMTRRNGLPQFWYEANFTSNDTEPLVIRLLFSEGGQLIGIGMGPKSQAVFDR